MRLTRTTAPSLAPVTLTEAKAQCRIDHDDEDDVIDALIAAAVDYLDGPSGILGRAMVTQTWLLELADWPSALALPIEPVSAVSVAYVDADLATQTLAPNSFDLISNPSARPLVQWRDGVELPTLGAVSFPVRITMTAGFGTPADVPAGLKAAIRMLVEHWFANRGVVAAGQAAPLPMGVSALLARWRVML